MPRLFISQEWVDVSNMEDKVTLDGELMVIKANGKAYRLTPAVRFLKVEGGDNDPHQLIGKVKTTKALEAMNAETMAESVLLGDTAYRVQPGFSALYTGTDNPVSAAFG
jgi:alpha-acetolactate decarboxylase